MGDGQVMFSAWVSRDPEDQAEGGRSFANLTLASSLNSTCASRNSFGGNLSAQFADISLGEVTCFFCFHLFKSSDRNLVCIFIFSFFAHQIIGFGGEVFVYPGLAMTISKCQN